ncbi:histidine kinase [Clostridiaceae bacterium M8S5]|nr:histidine kinase [Clostridiaceae bacterium M8S5]
MKKFIDFKIRNQIKFMIIMIVFILVTSSSIVLSMIGNILIERTKSYYKANTYVIEGNINTVLNSIMVNNNNYSYILEINKVIDEGLLNKRETRDYFINGYAKFNSLFNDTMEGIVLYPLNGEKIIVGNNDVASTVFYDIYTKYNISNNQYKSSFFTDSIYDHKTNKYYFGCLSPVYNSKTHNIEGYFISIINYKFVDNIFKLNDINELDATILLINDKNIMTSNKSMDNTVYNPVFNEINDEYISIQDVRYLYLEQPIANTNWKALILIPKNKILSKASPIKPIFILIGIISFLILAVITKLIIGAITKPVEIIAKKLDKYETSEQYKDIDSNVKNEINDIAIHINKMMKKVKTSNKALLDAQRELYQLELSNVQSKLSYYQSQINPHFLYNTLETIRSLSLIYNAYDIEQLSLSMSKIFRYAVKEDTIVNLDEELSCAYEYIKVMRLRFPDKFKYVVITDNTDKIYVPKMTLQPIIENCFKYGIKKTKKKVIILIQTKKIDNNIYLEIIDTGGGINIEILSELKKHLKNEKKILSSDELSTKLGLKNINKRIKLCFGNEYGISVKSSEGYYTKVIIKLPKQSSTII